MAMESINNFKLLFNLVCTCHTGPILFDFGRQMQWHGIVAGQCTKHIQYIHADGIDAVLDTKINKLRFNEGSAEMLENLLAAEIAAQSQA